jgi:tetratricopeptide (TPR) repeat protein
LATGLTELGTALVHSVRSHDDEGALLLERAALLAEEVGDHVTAAGAHRELGYVDALAGRRPAADVHLDDAERLADGDPGLLAGAVSVRAFNWCDWGRVPEGIAEYERALDLARSAGNQRRLAWSLGLGGWARLRAGDEAGAEAWLEECLVVVDALRWVAFQPWPVAALCELSLRRGDDPRDRMHEAFSLSCQLADPCWEGVSARALALESAERGRPDDALAWIADARARSLRETDTYVGLLGEILSTDITLSGRFDDAERAASSGRALLELAARAHLDGLIEVALAAVGTSPGGLSSSRYAWEDGQALDRDRSG